MTEDEAKKKWCPHATDHNRIVTGGKQDLVKDGPGKGVGWNCCIASDCMMWRLEREDYGDNYGDNIPVNRGYCGLTKR